MNNEWGLTERGFRRPTYEELLDATEYKARELFGANANLTVRSPLGIFLRIFAWMLNLVFLAVEEVYNSRFVDTAVGASLYNVGKIIGLRLLSARKASGYLLITGLPGHKIPAGFLASTVAGIQFVTITDVRIGDDGTVLVPSQAVAAGPDGNVAANTIKEIVNPTGGNSIKSVTNTEPIVGGANREQDDEYRDRYNKSVDNAGGVNDAGIRAELLKLEGVVSAEVYENFKDTPHPVYKIPGHSFECVVFGDLDHNVAQAIYKRKSFGIEPYGSTTVPVIATNGQAIDISFSRPAAISIWVKIEHLETDSSFADDGIQQVQDAVVSYIGNSAKSGGLGIGIKLYFLRLPEEIYKVQGVKDFELSISTDGVYFNTQNVSIDIREKAVTDYDKVVVTR